MKITAPASAWLANPASLVAIDFTDPEAVRGQVYLERPGSAMDNCGWLKIGTALITYDISVEGEEPAKAAAESIQAKIEQLERDHAAAIATLREGLSKLLAISYTRSNTFEG